jgi:hypothetical protein
LWAAQGLAGAIFFKSAVSTPINGSTSLSMTRGLLLSLATGLWLGGLAAKATAAAPAELPALRANGELRLVIVDRAKPAEAREAAHRVLAAGLGDALGRQIGGAMSVRVCRLDAAAAGAALVAGGCDGVLLFGDDRPRALRRADMIACCGDLDGFGYRPICLIVVRRPAGTEAALAVAFAHLVADRRLLKAADDAERTTATAAE